MEILAKRSKESLFHAIFYFIFSLTLCILTTSLSLKSNFSNAFMVFYILSILSFILTIFTACYFISCLVKLKKGAIYYDSKNFYVYRKWKLYEIPYNDIAQITTEKNTSKFAFKSGHIILMTKSGQKIYVNWCENFNYVYKKMYDILENNGYKL